MKHMLLTTTLLLALAAGGPARAAEYQIDTRGAHASIQFRIQHLGYSWLTGRFNRFSGHFSFDEQRPETAAVEVEIDTTSIDTNHAERDKHLRGGDFFDVEHYPQARFVSTAYRPLADGKGELEGQLTLHGITRPVTLAVEQVGHGADPWGGYRRGFYGTTTLILADFGFKRDLGPASRQVQLELAVEGIRQ